MAVTKILEVKTERHIETVLNYVENPAKTEYGQLVSGYNCNPEVADLEFALTAQHTESFVKRKSPKSPIFAYHIIQSFSPKDNVTPEQAHELGKQLANEFLGGEFEYVVSTHVDKGHIHNHIIINSTSWLTGKKLRTNPNKTWMQVRAISDQLCMNSGLSVIQNSNDDPKKYFDYKEWSERRQNNSWKAEIRKRLNFVLARATSYDEFLSMCNELDLAVDDSGKHIKYKCCDTAQQRWARGNNLDKSDAFTVDGIKEKVRENAEAKEILWGGLIEEMPQSDSWEDFTRQLEENHGIKITQGKLGLIYHFADGSKRKEAELGIAYSKQQLLMALRDPDYIPGDDPDASIRDEWELLEKKKLKLEEYTPVTLKMENIEKISPAGLLVKVPGQENPITVFIDNNHVEFNEDTEEYTIHIASPFRYYALREDTDPDLPESDQLGTKELRGEDIIRAFDREYGSPFHWIDVPAEFIRYAKPDMLTLSFEKDGVTNVRFKDPQDFKFSPTGCKVKIYDNWTYAQNFTGGEMRDILLNTKKPTIDQMLRKYRAYNRRSQFQQAQDLAQVLRTMDREGINSLNDFTVKRSELAGQIEAKQAQVKTLQKKTRDYMAVRRDLKTVETYRPIHDQVNQARGWAKSKLQQTHEKELQMYDLALKNLQAMGVNLNVQTDKVAGLLDNFADEIKWHESEIDSLRERRAELEKTESIVRELLGQEEEEEKADDRQQQKEEQRQTKQKTVGWER